MTNETAIKLVRDACSKQPEDGKFVLYEKDIEMIAQGFKSIVRAEALEEAAKVCEEGTDCEPECCINDWDEAQQSCAAAIRGLK